MSATAFLRASLRRLVRDRTALFFMVVLPILIILVIGLNVRGTGRLRIGLVDQGAGPLGDDLAAALTAEPSLEVHRLDTAQAAATAVRRSELTAAVVLPAGLDAQLRASGTATIEVIADQTSTAQQAATASIAAVVAQHGARIEAARFAADASNGDIEQWLDRAASLQAVLPDVSVETEVVNADSSILPEGFDYSAPTMLVLFVFINAIAGGAAMIETRRLGIYQRASAAPVSARTIIAGETMTYLVLSIGQAMLIILVGAVGFGVRWGDPVAAAALVLCWALLGTAAGMLSGTVFRTPEQASAIGPALGIALGMLGGCMWPLEIVGDTMRRVGHLVPHAWAVDAWTTLLSRNGSLADIGTDLTVLLGFSIVLLTAAALRLRLVLRS